MRYINLRFTYLHTYLMSVFRLLCALSYVTSKCQVIKHIENFSEDFSFTLLASWGREAAGSVRENV